MKKILTLTIVALFLSIGNAYALVVPTIDGLVGSATEWADYTVYGTDINEVGITDNWDIRAIWMKVVKNQGIDNGLYFRMDMYDTPTYVGGPNSGTMEAYFEFWLDYDGDGIEDYYIDLNNQAESKVRVLGVYQVGSPDILTGHGTAALNNIIEMHVPDSLLSTSFVDSKFGLFAIADGRGSESDDRLPGTGWATPVPEPASMALIGLGLLGLGGGVLRRRKKRFTA